jgi:hypothetical protein
MSSIFFVVFSQRFLLSIGTPGIVQAGPVDQVSHKEHYGKMKQDLDPLDLRQSHAPIEFTGRIT